MTEAVRQIYDAWGNRASAKEPDATTESERVYKVPGYSITVPDDRAQPAKVASLYNRWGASENPMPNVSFSDGEMRIPVEDFVDLILRRVPAEELAEGLWRDAEVRERFVYCMAHRYAGSLEDADRRKLLTEIQEAIYSVAIDQAIERLNRLESNARCYTDHYRWQRAELGHYNGLYKRYKGVLYEMREAGILDDEQITKRLKLVTTPEALKQYRDENVDPVVAECVGAEWRESRDYWRAQLRAFFAAPCDSDGTATAAANGDLPVPQDCQARLTPADLREARKRLGLTQHGLAAALRMGKSGWQSVSRWEQDGNTVPGPVQVAVEFMLAALVATSEGA